MTPNLTGVRPGDRIACYRNLKSNCISVLRGKHVVDHVAAIWLEDVVFRVQPGGYKRVRRDKQKNVHAFVIGSAIRLIDVFDQKQEIHSLLADFANSERKSSAIRLIKYNPYKGDYFYDSESLQAVSATKFCCVTPQGILIY